MTQQTNTDKVKAIYEAFGRGDLDFILDNISPAIVWKVVGAPGLPYGGTFHGRDGASEWFKLNFGTIDTTAFDITDYIESGDWVIAKGTYGFKAKTTGKDGTGDWVMCWKFADGVPVLYENYFDSLQVYEALQ